MLVTYMVVTREGITIAEGVRDVDSVDEWPTTSFTQARDLYLDRVANRPLHSLDRQHLILADAVLHMAYGMDGVLVQEVFDPSGNCTLGYKRIDPEIEQGVTFVLIAAVEKLDEHLS